MTYQVPKYPVRMIAFSGPKYSGKDTAAKVLFAQNDKYHNTFWRHPFAGDAEPGLLRGVKGICALAFGYTPEMIEDPVLKEVPTETWPFIEPRFPMMDIANWMRDKYGGDIWCRAHERNINPNYKAQVITDHRFPEEIEYLESWGMAPNYCEALTLYIQRDEAEEALKAAQKSGSVMANNPSEMFYDKIKERAGLNSLDNVHPQTVIIDNNGTIEQLHGQVLAAVRNHFGFWGHWE